MAIDFYELGRQTGAKTPKGRQSGLQSLVGSIDKTISGMLKTSQAKTTALTAAMPQGIPIDKVPEELRIKATEFLTKNKTAYTDATKVIASGINAQSERYKNAVETINRVNTRFENLSTSLEAVALKRQASLDDPMGYSPGTNPEDRLTWSNLGNGDLYAGMTFNEDGTVNYTDSKGVSKPFADFNVSPQSFEGQNTFLALNDKYTGAKYSGKTKDWSLHSGEAELRINQLFQKLKPAGQKDMMMADVLYLEKLTGFEAGTDEYEAEYSKLLENPADAIAGYKSHILETLEKNYNDQSAKPIPGSKNPNDLNNNKFGGWGSYNVKTGGTSEFDPVSILWSDAAKRRSSLDDLSTVYGEHGIYNWDGKKYTDQNGNSYSIKELVGQEGLYKPLERLSDFEDAAFFQNKDDKENLDKGLATFSMLKEEGDNNVSNKLNTNFGLDDDSPYKFVPYSNVKGKGFFGYWHGWDDNIFMNDLMLINPKTNRPLLDKNNNVIKIGTGDDAKNTELNFINEFFKDNVTKGFDVNDEFSDK